jgi:hypothetical protein
VARLYVCVLKFTFVAVPAAAEVNSNFKRRDNEIATSHP